MKELYLTNETQGISIPEVEACMDELLAQYPDLKKVLIIPPDFTRCYSCLLYTSVFLCMVHSS